MVSTGSFTKKAVKSAPEAGVWLNTVAICDEFPALLTAVELAKKLNRVDSIVVEHLRKQNNV